MLLYTDISHEKRFTNKSQLNSKYFHILVICDLTQFEKRCLHNMTSCNK